MISSKLLVHLMISYSVKKRKTMVLLLVIMLSFSLSAQTPLDLLGSDYNFVSSNHIVGTSFFHWYTTDAGQLSGPWVPKEGRDNWTGEPEFFKTMVKQAMAANIDVLYVHLIPHMDQQRINLFQALYELRTEGWDVPKVAPFFDPLITYNIQGGKVDVGTTAGKDELVGHYIRFFEQFYGQNDDGYADDYIYTIDSKVVLNTWHVHLDVENYDQLLRSDVEERLTKAFSNHRVFGNGIYMVTTAYSPSFTFADEKVPQFEIHEYYKEYNHNGILSAQIKPGYWDQNVREPGTNLVRDGGVNYANAWGQLGYSVKRVYIESFNEYDEGSGIYAALPDSIFRNHLNDENDTWSTTNNPYEYIQATAAGAAMFNDDDDFDTKIVWHNIPDHIYPGETVQVSVVVRNGGNQLWNETNKIAFGQLDSDPILFSASQMSIDDLQDEIAEYGGIFRGRVKQFDFELSAPLEERSFQANWSMFKENVQFGELISKTIAVSSVITGLNSQSDQLEINIYPNPVGNNGSIQIYGSFSENDQIIVLNVLGQRVEQKSLNENKKTVRIQLTRLNDNGFVIVKIIRNNEVLTRKVLVGR